MFIKENQKILLVSGDSWTDPDFISAEHPTLDCTWPKWPEILAKNLNMKCVNLGKCGQGNEYIYSSILDQLQVIDHKQIGYVIAGWSGAPRRDYATTYDMNILWRAQKEDRKGDLHYWMQRSIRYYYSLQEIMKHLKLPYMQMQMVSMYKGHLYAKEREKVYSREIAQLEKRVALNSLLKTPYIFNDKFLGWPTDKDLGGFSIDVDIIQDDAHKISTLDRHPNKKGQEKIAEYIHENI